MMASRRVYLDHHATTPVDSRVADVVMAAMVTDFGNANSVDHCFGDAARHLVGVAAHNVASLVDADPEGVLFTSGSTEAISRAVDDVLWRTRGRKPRIAVTRVEHSAVLDAVQRAITTTDGEIHWVDVDQYARLNIAHFDQVLARGIDLVCVMAANNEVGTVYPVRECAARAHAAGAALLVDGTQAAGHLQLSVRADRIDYLVLSAHKMYGPKGVGALLTDTPSGSNEHWRRGTPNVPGIAGLGEACRLRRMEMAADEARIGQLRDRLQSVLQADIPGLIVNGDQQNRLAGNLHISIPGVPNDAVVSRLRNAVAISTGAACVSGTQAPSHVLQAMGLSDALQEGALRIGIGKFNTEDEIQWAADQLVASVSLLRDALQL
jgi:cysteine desulfurase